MWENRVKIAYDITIIKKRLLLATTSISNSEVEETTPIFALIKTLQNALTTLDAFLGISTPQQFDPILKIKYKSKGIRVRRRNFAPRDQDDCHSTVNSYFTIEELQRAVQV